MSLGARLLRMEEFKDAAAIFDAEANSRCIKMQEKLSVTTQGTIFPMVTLSNSINVIVLHPVSGKSRPRRISGS